MKTYAIASFLSDAQKQAILSHRYVGHGEPTGDELDGEPVLHVGLMPVSAEDGATCPLGYLPTSQEMFNQSAPCGSEVARIVVTEREMHDRLEHHDKGCELRLQPGEVASFEQTDQGLDCDCDSRLMTAVAEAADEFINDWDLGWIHPSLLAKALGVVDGD